MPKYKVNEQNFFEVLKSGDYRCGFCGNNMDDKSIVSDFKIPRSLGGEDTLDNLLAVCKDCSKLKGQMTVEEFRASILEAISAMLDKAYLAYEKVSGLLDADTDSEVRAALVSAKLVMKRKKELQAVTFFFEESGIKVMPLVAPAPEEMEVKQ